MEIAVRFMSEQSVADQPSATCRLSEGLWTRRLEVLRIRQPFEQLRVHVLLAADDNHVADSIRSEDLTVHDSPAGDRLSGQKSQAQTPLSACIRVRHSVAVSRNQAMPLVFRR